MSIRYVDVICHFNKEGIIKPLYLIWDQNQKIPITRVTEVCPRSSLQAGYTGLRYTCVFDANRIRHLFYDRGRWYVETR